VKNLVLCNIPWYSGLSHYALDIAKALLEEKEDVFWALEPDTVLWRKVSETPIIKISQTNRKSFNFIKNLSLIKKVLPEPDRIFAFTGQGLFLGYLLKRKHKSKLYRFRTESYYIKKNIFNRYLYKSCDFVFAGNKKIALEIEKLGVERVEVLYGGVDTEKFVFSPIPEEKRIGYVGRLGFVKGIDVLWEAMNKVWEKIPDLKLAIAGGDTKQYQWENIKENFKGPVEYFGKISEEDVPSFMKECLFGVIPSTGSEATSRVLLEWWATGRGVVASCVGMIGEVAEDGKDSFLVEPKNPHKLSEKILLSFSDQKLISFFSHNARSKVEKEFSLKIFKQRLFERI